MIAAHTHSHGTLGQSPARLGLQREPGGWDGASQSRTQSDKLELAGPGSPLVQPSHFAEKGLGQGFWGVVTESRRAGETETGEGTSGGQREQIN